MKKICTLPHALPRCHGFERSYATIHGKISLGDLIKKIKSRSLVNSEVDKNTNELENIIDNLIDKELSSLRLDD